MKTPKISKPLHPLSINEWLTGSLYGSQKTKIKIYYPGVRENCFYYALEQLRQVGRWVKSERWNKRWDGTKELNDYIYQLYLDHDVAGMKKGVQKDQFEKGVEYLKKTLK
jgi:hypothetical protein